MPLLLVLADLAFSSAGVGEHINSDETKKDSPMQVMLLEMIPDLVEMVKLRLQIVLGKPVRVKCLHDDGTYEQHLHTNLGCCLVRFVDGLVVDVEQPPDKTCIDNSNDWG